MAKSRQLPSIGEYLIEAFRGHGVNHIFGVPGDFILGLHVIGDQRGMRMVNCTREECATYAADGYAREKGLAGVAVTYGVGILATMAALGGANAEGVPVVVIGGAPGRGEHDGRRIHHMPSSDLASPWRMMQEITAPRSVVLDDPDEAYDQIDWLLRTVVDSKMPGYIELPRDMINTSPTSSHTLPRSPEPMVPMERIQAAADDVIARINAAKNPVMWVGHLSRREHMGDELLELAEAAGMPIVESVMGKGSVDESHPLVAGVYVGAGTKPELREFVESADLVVQAGINVNDVTTGAFSASIPVEKRIHISRDRTEVAHHTYAGVDLRGLGLVLRRRKDEMKRRKPPKNLPYAWADEVTDAERITTDVVADRLQRFVQKSDIILSDVGVGAHLAMDARFARSEQFHIARLYVGMGFAVPAAYGAALARGKGRPIVLVGDGSFQMTGFDVSTAIREGVAPIVLVLDNHGYGAERSIHDGAFNDIAQWDYAAVGGVVGAIGVQVFTPDQLDEALARARKDRDTAYIIQVDLDQMDVPRGLKALGEGLASLMH